MNLEDSVLSGINHKLKENMYDSISKYVGCRVLKYIETYNMILKTRKMNKMVSYFLMIGV